jgi:hypothetical protein
VRRWYFPEAETTQVRVIGETDANGLLSGTNRNSLCHSKRFWKPLWGRVALIGWRTIVDSRERSLVIISPGILKQLVGHLRGDQIFSENNFAGYKRTQNTGIFVGTRSTAGMAS